MKQLPLVHLHQGFFSYNFWKVSKCIYGFEIVMGFVIFACYSKVNQMRGGVLYYYENGTRHTYTISGMC